MSPPRTRAGCPVTGKCPHVGCRYHLLLDVGKVSLLSPGQPALRHPLRNMPAAYKAEYKERAKRWASDLADRLAEAEETCALDVADKGPHSLAEISDLLGITKQRISIVEQDALRKIRAVASTANLPELLAEMRRMRERAMEQEWS